jgi:hypothetical protein
MEPRSRKVSLPAAIGILATVIGAVVGIYYTVKQLERWNTEDRPRVLASTPRIPLRMLPFPKPSTLPVQAKAIYEFTLTNTGIEDATNVKIKVAATDLLHTHTTRLLKQAVYEIPKLARGINQPVTTDVENDQDFIVVCIEYGNAGGARFLDPPKFYATPLGTAPPNSRWTLRSLPDPVPALENDKLLEGFSCAKL